MADRELMVHACCGFLTMITELLELETGFEYSKLPLVVAELVEQDKTTSRLYEDLKKQLETEPVPDVIKVIPGYESLAEVLNGALLQAAIGKGKDRHAREGLPFEKQKLCGITREVGLGFPIGQAIKKAVESRRLGDRGPAKLLGAINYLAAAYLVMDEGHAAALKGASQ